MCAIPASSQSQIYSAAESIATQPAPNSQRRHHTNRYRPDIDGLRALAVLPVVAFHAGVHLVRGGFVGVDIFFVISGYLITQQMYPEILEERFSILSFYERRIRRIFPALIAVLGATFVLGAVYAMPVEMIDLCKSLVAAVLSVSNVYFYFSSGYFEEPALTKPLLHTWSLAVEEQFYLFWPIFLILGRRWLGRRVLHLTLVVAALSFAVSIIGAFQFPTATFYLPLTRIWELAVGGLLALGAVPVILGSVARNAATAVGIGLIFAAVLFTQPDLPFPGLLAVPPCLGAVLVILGGRDGSTLGGRILSLRVLTFIGAISYSLYLWHWPIVVFQRKYTFLASGLSEPNNKILIVAVSLLAASASWKLIEQPFRSGRHRPDRTLLLKFAATGTLLLVVLGIVGWDAQGFPGRYSKRELEVASLLSYNADKPYGVDRCFLVHFDKRALAPDCLALSGSAKNYLLLGDSHAAELWSGLREAAPDRHFMLASAVDCFPTLTHALGESLPCSRVLDGVIKDYLRTHRVDRIFLVARWKTSVIDNLAATIDWMKQHDIPVTLVGPSSFYDAPVPYLMVDALRRSDPTRPEHHFDASVLRLDAQLEAMARAHAVPYVSLLQLQCPAGRCEYQDAAGMPFIFDREHLTAEGSLLMARKLLALEGIW